MYVLPVCVEPIARQVKGKYVNHIQSVFSTELLVNRRNKKQRLGNAIHGKTDYLVQRA